MRVAITGGTGLIGRALAADLTEDGHEVIVISRRPEHATDLPLGVRAESWSAPSMAEGVDAIVNLAGENLSSGRWTDERKRRIVESRLGAGRAVVRAIEAAARKPTVLIQSSAIGYYGSQGDKELTEDSPPGSDFLANVCLQWEASTAPVETMGVRRAIIRTAPVLSTEGGALPRILLPFRLLVGGPIGHGRQWFSWIQIADEVGAIRFLIENLSATGPYNLASPNPLPYAQFSKAVGRALHRPSWVPVPAFALRLLYGEMADTLLTSQRVLPHRLMDQGFQFRFPDIDAALRDLLE